MNVCAQLHRLATQAIATSVAVVFLLVQFGCVAKPPSLELHYQLRNQVVALLPAQLETELVSAPFAGTRTTGALKGAEEGFVGCLEGFAHGSCSGDVCGAVLLVLLAVAVTCSAIGAVAGAARATPEATARQLTTTVDSAFSGLGAHLDLTRRVLAEISGIEGVTAELVSGEGTAPHDERGRWQTLAARGFTKALEIGVTRIAFSGGRGSDPELALQMQSVVKVVDLPDGTERYRQVFKYHGPVHRYSRWVQLDGMEMRRAVDVGLETLAGQVTTRLFEQVDLGIPSGTWTLPGSERFSCCWLCPLSPPLDYSFWGKRLNYPQVDSLQPTLSWEALPARAQAGALDQHHGGGLTSVHYELRVWEVRAGQPGPLVYERRALPQPHHRLESPLKPRRDYFWSFRACFDAAQGVTCTPWAWSLAPAGGSCEEPEIPAQNYYRFRT